MNKLGTFIKILETALVAAVFLSCSKQTPDDEIRLKKKIDVTPVHLWAATKYVLTEPGADPALEKSVEKILRIVSEQKLDADTKPALGDLFSLGKAILTLKSAGRQIVIGEKDEGAPLLKKTLLILKVPLPLPDLFNRDTDHGVLFLTSGMLKISEKSPIPVPSELVLHEAWRTETSNISIPGLGFAVHGLRAFHYGMNDFCYLAEKDATAVSKTGLTANDLIKALGIPSEKSLNNIDKELKVITSSIRVLGNSGAAICYYKRGNDKAARPWLKTALDEADSLGIANEMASKYLRIFVDCGGAKEEINKGIAALADLPKSEDQAENIEKDLLSAYCQASDENKTEIMRKLSLSAKILKIALTTAKNTEISEKLKSSDVYRASSGILSIFDKASSASSSASGIIDSLKKFVPSPSLNDQDEEKMP